MQLKVQNEDVFYWFRRYFLLYWISVHIWTFMQVYPYERKAAIEVLPRYINKMFVDKRSSLIYAAGIYDHVLHSGRKIDDRAYKTFSMRNRRSVGVSKGVCKVQKSQVQCWGNTIHKRCLKKRCLFWFLCRSRSNSWKNLDNGGWSVKCPCHYFTKIGPLELFTKDIKILRFIRIIIYINPRLTPLLRQLVYCTINEQKSTIFVVAIQVIDILFKPNLHRRALFIYISHRCITSDRQS